MRDKYTRVLSELQIICSVEGNYNFVPCYGTLLGFVRDGDYIGHDDDVDATVILDVKTRDDVIPAYGDLARFLESVGCKLYPLFFGQILVEYEGLFFDIFISWFDENSDFSLFEYAYKVAKKEDFFPLQPITIRGRSIKIPKNPEILLQALYGEGWETPDPTFRYEISWDIRDKFWFLKKGFPIATSKAYWDAYHTNALSQHSHSQFAVMCAQELSKEGEVIVDLGCGDARDSVFFASLGHTVSSIDVSEVGFESNEAAMTSELISFHLSDRKGVGSENVEVIKKATAVYARFLLHCLPLKAQSKILDDIVENLTSGRVFLEFRTDQDPKMDQGLYISEYERLNDIYHRYITVDNLVLDCEKRGLKLLYKVEGSGLAKCGKDDPVVCRLIFEKPNSSDIC